MNTLGQAAPASQPQKAIPMFAYTIDQDTLDGILSGDHTLIITSWETSHRGPLLLMVVDSIRTAFLRPHRARSGCIVDVLGCRPMDPADAAAAGVEYREHRIAWEIAGVQPVAPFTHDQCMGFIYEVELPAAFTTPPVEAITVPEVKLPGSRQREGFPDLAPGPTTRRRTAPARVEVTNDFGGLFG